MFIKEIREMLSYFCFCHIDRENNQVGRIVKAPDLISGPRMGSWVYSPHLVYVSQISHCFPLTILLDVNKINS